jgi:hypothetical protein
MQLVHLLVPTCSTNQRDRGQYRRPCRADIR